MITILTPFIPLSFKGEGDKGGYRKIMWRASVKNRFEFVPGIQHGEVRINNMGIEQFHPHSSLKDLGFEQEEFVREANYLLDKYKIKVPHDFPKPIVTKEALFGEKPVHVYHTHTVGVCFCNCIQLEKINVNTAKLLRELIKPDPIEGLLHSTSISVIALEYVDKGYKVELFPRTKAGRKPDLLVDGIFCDVKVIQESDWTKEALKNEHREEFLTTGMAPPHYIRDGICFDVGKFIEIRSSDGIQQAEMLLVDLSLKSLPNLHGMAGVQRQTLPPPKRNRIVFFCCAFHEGKVESGYYLDFDPSLWEVIRSCDKKMRRGWLPPPLGWADSAKTN